MSTAIDDPVVIPPSERREINSMAEKFKDALKGTPPAVIAPTTAPPKPAAPKDDPASKTSVKPPETSPATVPKPAPVSAPATDPVKPSDPEPEMPKNAKDWKAFKEVREKAVADAKAAAAERDALKAEHAAQKAELETMKKGSAEWQQVKAEYDGTKKQLEEWQGLINRFALEQDPRFQNHYNGRIQQAKEIALGATHGEATARLDQILAMPPSKIRDEQMKALTTEMDEMDRAEIAAAYVNIKAVEREKLAELAKSSENLAMARSQAQKQQQEEQAQRQSHLTAVLDLAHQTIAPDLEGAEEADATSFKEMARKLVFGTLDQGDLLTVAKYAAKGRKHDAAMAALREENAKLQTQVAELTSASPPVNGSGGGTPMHNKRGPLDHSDVGAKFKAEMAKRAGQR